MGYKVAKCPTLSTQGTMAHYDFHLVFEILANLILNGKPTVLISTFRPWSDISLAYTASGGTTIVMCEWI